jgi:hypothetical protein
MMRSARSETISVLGCAIFFMGLSAGAVRAQDPCEQQAKALESIRAQLEAKKEELASEKCAGPARLGCQNAVRALEGRSRAAARALLQCRQGQPPPTPPPPSPVPPHLPFDLLPRPQDVAGGPPGANPRWDYLNNIPLNPMWASQVYESELPNPQRDCNASHGSNQASDWARCTGDPVWINEASCAGGGHVNWWPVTYEGTVGWQEYSSDQDYNVWIADQERAARTTANPDGIGMEFDSRETVDPFSEKHAWWRKLRDEVDDDSENPAGIHRAHAVVIGLLGMDFQHKSWTELHPLYVLAVNYDDSNSKWAFFFRNWGNEGGCSDGSNPWDVRTISILLRNAAAGNATVPISAVFGSPGTSISYYFVRGQGVVLEVVLPAPDEEGHVFGDLTVAWTPAPPPQALASVPPKFERARAERPGEEGPFREFYAGLPAATQQRWLEASRRLARARVARVAPLALQMLPTRDAIVASVGPSPRARLAHDAGRRKAEDEALCAALGTEASRFAKLCRRDR